MKRPMNSLVLEILRSKNGHGTDQTKTTGHLQMMMTKRKMMMMTVMMLMKGIIKKDDDDDDDMRMSQAICWFQHS